MGGHQERELGLGVAGGLGAELRLAQALGIEAALGALWLSEGDAPEDATLASEGDASAVWGGLGLRFHPFAAASPKKAESPVGAGPWLGARGGITSTGSDGRTGTRTRPVFTAELGYDVALANGRAGVGPMVGLWHVFQPDDELRPADANVVLLGIHAMFDTSGARPAPEGDRDGDGLLDSRDRCPDDPEDQDGYQDGDGCPEPDNDGDGILDVSDRCPMTPEDADGFEDSDGCPDTDNDRDGIVDVRDRCPNEPEDKDDFEDDDGCPDADNDRDGLLDPNDQCPNEPETKNGYADDDGCPDEQQVRVVGDKIVLDDRIHFRTNNAVIRPMSYPLLERLAKLVKDHPEYVHIHIEGHADERGADAFNQRLSENRARAVLAFLAKHGVAAERLSSEGFGSTQPLVEGSNEYAWLKNRRVEFRVTRQTKERP